MQRRTILFLMACCALLPISVARGDEAAEKLVLATYKLANDASTASCVAIRTDGEAGKTRCVIVTAQHVLNQMAGDVCVLVSRTRNDNGTYQRQELQIPIRASGRPLWFTHPQHDIAVLPLPEGAPVEALPLDSLATDEILAEVRVGDDVRLAVFPERAEANDAGFPVLRSGSIAGHPVTPAALHSTLLIDTTSWTGDSGGPVMHATLRSPSGGPLVIGIVRGMRNITDAVKESRFVERRTHYPLGLTEALQAVLAREPIATAVANK